MVTYIDYRNLAKRPVKYVFINCTRWPCDNTNQQHSCTQLMHTTTSTLRLHPFNGLFWRTTSVSGYQKGKTSLDLNEARDDGVLGYSGISWAICNKQSAPRCRQITTPTPHHPIFTGWMLFLTPNQQCQSTEGINIS